MNQSQTGGKGMKSKMLIATLLGCLVWQQGALSQTHTIATDTNQSIGTSTINPPMVPATSTTVSSSATSSVAALTVVFPPFITAQPTSQTVVNGNNATFSVTAEGTPPLSYQWYFNGSVISGAMAANYNIIGVTASNEGNYTVVITNSYGSVTSSNAIVGTSAATPPTAPVISAPESPSTTTSSVTTSTVTTNEPAGTSAATPPMAPAVTANESPSVTTSSVTTSTVTTSNETTGASAATPPTAPAVSAPESPSTTTSSVTTSTVTTTNETTGASAATSPGAPAVTANESSSVTTSSETASAAKPQPSEPPSIPLIQFQDVPITTAIENLARQAGINYLIDPKIGYGQPDQNGQIKAEPTLSIRWENVTAEQALMALLDNYGLQLNEDRQSQIARITAKDPTAPPPLITRVVQLKYASTSNMVDAVQAALIDKRSKVLADTRTSQIIVVATEKELETMDALINELDKPTRQVLIETKLIQISSTPKTAKGVDWSGTLGAQNLSFGNGLIDSSKSATTASIPGTTTTAPTSNGGYTGSSTSSSSQQTALSIIQGAGGMNWNTISGFTPAIGFLNADGVHAVLSFLNSSYDAQVVSTPRIVTLDNEMATIEVTRTYPVINMAGGTQNSAGSSSVTYSNVGTILQVTPHISANDYIRLKVAPEVSSFFGNITVTVQGGQGNSSTTYPIPEFDYRRINTQVLIPNGNTLVMGGLVQDNPTASYSKVPVLGDIPGLGWAFRSETKTMTKDNLIIFMTPTIIKDSDFQPNSTDYLKSRPNTMRSPMNPNTVWDGAEPRGDWSNPAPAPGEFDKK
jgi:type II secretory pathway component GspD/PulD (secretin)